MKSKKKQRILALILSMVLMLSASISALAEGDVQTEASGTETTENQAAVQSLEQETVPETEVTTEEGGIDTQSAETSTEPVQENTEQEVTETPAEPEQGVTEETTETTDTTQSQAQSTEVQEESDAAEEIPVEEQPGETTEETATEETVVSEAAELKQEFTDENGNVTQTVTAYVPEGAFQATADQISMEVSLLNTDDTNYIKGMMEELLPENHYLDGYVLYQIDFKVNGEITQPAKAVTITMNGNDLAVEDTQKAHVFYYDAADPEVEGDKDQLIEVIQKDQLLKSLEESGQSTENIEDYDYSEIAVNEGNANTITVKGWESTIYGCYVEKEAVTELTYEDDSVTVTVSADQAGIIPDGAELSVTPITKTEITDDMSKEEKAQAEEINAQYDFTEEQLQKDSEENATTMEGFLAYDICFLVDGEEIEPSGDVKVVMDFKEAAVPEGVSEDAEVAVKHLKEDESAEDGVIVEDMAEKASVQTTDAAAVERVEFSSNHFSVYVLNWVYQNSTLTVYTVAWDGNPIGSDGERDIYFPNQQPYKEIAVSECAPEIENYEFAYAYIEGQEEERGNINSICYWTSGNYNPGRGDLPFTLKTQTGDGDYRVTEDDTIYFVYATNDDRPQTVPTNSENIDINLFNYNANINSGNLYNAGFGFYASTAGEDGSSLYTGRFTNSNNDSPAGGQGLLQNIVKKNLRNGIPVLNTRNGISMNSLFSSGDTSSKTSYTNLSGLFQLGADGYYTYDSLLNGAVLDGNEIKVYDTIVTPDFADYGNFLPFNSEWVNETYSGVPYKFSSRSEIDLWFGMNIGLNFYQPESGKINGEDMIFEFSGDDDVWVFIDGVLVLDLGGIHDRLNGTINFSSGTVTAGSTTTTLRACYEAAYEELYPNADEQEVQDYLNGIFDASGKFLNYSDHRLEFFYLERGGGAANCRLRFNMPTLPNDGITVSKLIDNYDEGAYSDVEFQFELYLDKDGDGEVSDSEIVTANDTKYNTYTIKEIGSTGAGETRTLGEDGIFTLKHGEMATFSNIQVTTKYKIKEVGISSDEYDDIQITSGITDQTGDVDLTDSTDHSGYAESKVLEVGSNIQVIFHNRCNPTNMKQLYIYKDLAGADTSDDTYRIQVIVGGSPYQGEYQLGTSAGSGDRLSTTDGWISFKAGQVITVLGNVTSEDGNTTGFPSGTTFEVVEDVQSLDADTYGSPTYSIKEGTATVINTEDKASGVFVLERNAEVTVTNNLKGVPDTPYIEIQKTFDGLEASEVPNNFKIELYANRDDVEPVKILTLSDASSSDNLTYVWRCDDLEPGTYYVKESGEEVAGYTVTTITMNGQEVSNSDRIQIDTQSPEFEATGVHQINSNKETEFSFNQNNFIAASLKDQSIFVWTKDTLSIGERQAILTVINNEGSGNLAGKATLDNTAFYSTIDRLEEGIVVGDGAIYVENGKLSFTATSQWQHVIAGQYTVTKAVNAEIEIVNTYTPEAVSIDVQKYGTEYTTDQLLGAKFTLYQQVTEESGTVTWNEVDDYTDFDVTADKVELELQSGFYKLEETTAPIGYSKLSVPIYFKVDGQNVTLAKEDGTAYETGEVLPDMWQLAEGETIQLQIKNEVLYELPSAGGPGIFLYMIGGTLLLMAGSLMIYINRRKGVLRK